MEKIYFCYDKDNAVCKLLKRTLDRAGIKFRLVTPSEGFAAPSMMVRAENFFGFEDCKEAIEYFKWLNGRKNYWLKCRHYQIMMRKK